MCVCSHITEQHHHAPEFGCEAHSHLNLRTAVARKLLCEWQERRMIVEKDGERCQ
jgi:hypothetical protein